MFICTINHLLSFFFSVFHAIKGVCLFFVISDAFLFRPDIFGSFSDISLILCICSDYLLFPIQNADMKYRYPVPAPGIFLSSLFHICPDYRQTLLCPAVFLIWKPIAHYTGKPAPDTLYPGFYFPEVYELPHPASHCQGFPVFPSLLPSKISSASKTL